MRKHFLLTKTLLVALLCLVGQSVWGAAALTKSFAVTGYKAVNLFDFQNLDYDGTALANFDALTSKGVTAQNTIGTAYGSNNWYDDRANNHGLRLQSGGSRWIQFTVDVKKDDYIIINGGTASEAYEIAMTNGESVAVAGASDYLCFKATQNASNVKLTVHRYNYLLQILIMTKDNTAETGDYTITYKYNDLVVGTDEGTGVAVGTSINVASSKVYNNVKYIKEDGQPSSLTIAKGSNNLEVSMRLAATYGYTVNAVDGSNVVLKQLATGSAFEGDAATTVYPRYILSGKTLYCSGSGGVSYSTTFTPNVDGYVKNVSYNSALVNNVVFYTEAEKVTGASEGANAARASEGKMGYTGSATTFLDVTTLEPGKYMLYLRGQNGNSAARAYDFKVGETSVFSGSIANGTNVDKNSEEFTVDASSTLSFASEGSSASGIDYFYVVRTAPLSVEITSTTGYATFASPYALDLTTANLPSGVTAYKASVSGTTVTFTALNQTVPANTGVLLQGTGTVNIPVAATGTAVEDNDFLVNEGGATFDGDDSYYYFGLVKDSNPLTFRKFVPSTTAIPADKAYLKVLKSSVDATARGLEFVFDDDVTSIGEELRVKNLTPALSQGEGVWYDLQGRKVAQPQKGLYIVNGKKVVLK